MNEERRLCGLAGDDDEDNMDEDRAALFGATADDAISVDGGHVEEPPAPDGNSAKRPRSSTSPVWVDYEKLFKEIDEKRVLGLVLNDVSHNGQNITDRVASVLADYGLSEKIFAVTLDNASYNASAMHKLKPILSKYLGLEVIDESDQFYVLASALCMSYSDLIVKEALTTLKPLIETFRTAISFLNSSNQRIAAYKSYCIATGVRPRKFQLDMEVRWNSIYLMLKHLFPHKSPFPTFIQAQYPRDEGESLLLTEDHWMMAQKVLSFLELFYDATVILSGVYYPTSSLMIHYLVKISMHLKNYANDVHIRSVVQPMIDKYNKYWRDIPLLYSFAFILDPRAKMKGFTRVLRRLGNLTSTDYSVYLVGTRARLADVYNKYDEKYGAVSLRRTDPNVMSGKLRSTWDEIYDDNGPVLGGGILLGNPNMSRDTSATSLLNAVRSSASNSSELVSYLDCDTVNHLTDDFNILDWWHQHKLIYPVLSIMAKDILTVPVSTISSESTFSMTGRIIEERRRSLKPEMVEMLTCIKDWEAAKARLQQNVEDKELEEAFEQFYLDS
ncbi:zinc finger BED domain-containing protein RICESLEEPER 2-like [Panicum virgatum]|uniref:zinc finger BED domain-containing protein RICESLEEPER 2-like n=1 Tax=Panicum virgatum TaxID=38727 RepID=UPI0019D5A2C8|nr:zinc finger BED domain-containing protein RICESLEEPER 2-like [Panicum virgatum]